MATVYMAKQESLDRIVAVKVAHASFSERFEREARTIASLNHPNIAAIYGLEESPATGDRPGLQALVLAGDPLLHVGRGRYVLGVHLEVLGGESLRGDPAASDARRSRSWRRAKS